MSETTFVQEGNLLDYTPVADTKAGVIIFRGNVCGQVAADIGANEVGALRTEGVIRVTKNSGDVFDVAAAVDVHWDNTLKIASLIAADGLMGRAVGGGANGQTHVDVKINA